MINYCGTLTQLPLAIICWGDGGWSGSVLVVGCWVLSPFLMLCYVENPRYKPVWALWTAPVGELKIVFHAKELASWLGLLQWLLGICPPHPICKYPFCKGLASESSYLYWSLESFLDEINSISTCMALNIGVWPTALPPSRWTLPVRPHSWAVRIGTLAFTRCLWVLNRFFFPCEPQNCWGWLQSTPVAPVLCCHLTHVPQNSFEYPDAPVLN